MSDKTHDIDDEPVDPRWAALARHLAGEADAADAETARAWLESDRDEAALIAALDRSLDRLAFTPPPNLDVEAALERCKGCFPERAAATPVTATATESEGARVLPFERPARALPSTRTAPNRTLWRVAAAVVVVAGGAYALRDSFGRTADAQHFATAVGQRDSVQLADGTRVILGPGSTLDVAAGYGGERREVQLRGEASFQVRHDAAKPFVVHTAAAAIEDVGTVFVVRDGGEGRVSIAVTEGSVMVRAAGEQNGTGVVMRAGDRGSVAPGQALTPAKLGDDAGAWTAGRLVFQDAPIADVAASLRRWYGIELRADSALASRTLTATFQGESAAEALRVVTLALGATLEQRGDTVIAHASASR